VPGPFPLNSLAGSITATGYSAPPFSDLTASIRAEAQAIFGADISLDPDDQDWQIYTIIMLAINAINNLVGAGYNSFSPAYAVGAGLSSVVKINGLRRQSSSNSTAPILIVGQAGTQIIGGLLADAARNSWALPSVVNIPFEGQIIVTATCTVSGAIQAASHTIGDPTGGGAITTPTPGWQTATNPEPAIPGAPVETDAQLRLRQTASTSLPAKTTRAAIQANIEQVPGVTYATVIENSQDAPDAAGIPGHSIAAVVAGGDVTAVATAIAAVKSPGTGTFGTTQIVVLDSMGVPDTINFFELDYVQIYVTITVVPLQGFLSSTGSLIAAAVSTYINGLGAGAPVYPSKLASPANLEGSAAINSSGLTQAQLEALSATYIVQSILIGLSPSNQQQTPISMLFYQAAAGPVANIVISPVPVS